MVRKLLFERDFSQRRCGQYRAELSDDEKDTSSATEEILLESTDNSPNSIVCARADFYFLTGNFMSRSCFVEESAKRSSIEAQAPPS